MELKSFCLDVGNMEGGNASRRNVYLLKIDAKSFRDARQDIVRIQEVIWDHFASF